jgi:hypothetical protein
MSGTQTPHCRRRQIVSAMILQFFSGRPKPSAVRSTIARRGTSLVASADLAKYAPAVSISPSGSPGSGAPLQQSSQVPMTRCSEVACADLAPRLRSNKLRDILSVTVHTGTKYEDASARREVTGKYQDTGAQVFMSSLQATPAHTPESPNSPKMPNPQTVRQSPTVRGTPQG